MRIRKSHNYNKIVGFTFDEYCIYFRRTLIFSKSKKNNWLLLLNETFYMFSILNDTHNFYLLLDLKERFTTILYTLQIIEHMIMSIVFHLSEYWMHFAAYYLKSLKTDFKLMPNSCEIQTKSNSEKLWRNNSWVTHEWWNVNVTI